MPLYISLAPFQGITGKVYRNAFARHFPGLDDVYAPFISGLHPDKVPLSKFSDVLPVKDHAILTVPQFVSVNAAEIIAIAQTLEQEGYIHINWNMGCPFSRIAHKKRGCGILPYPDTIRVLLDEIMPRIPLALSIKTRLGYYNPDEIFKVIEVLNEYPVHRLIIHPRIGLQRYKGDTRPKVFGQCLSLSKIPLVYNGDIFHVSRYRQLQALFPDTTQWMVGRGALINPFFPSQIKGIILDEKDKTERIKAFHQELFEGLIVPGLPEKKILGRMKAVWYYLHGLFLGGKQYFEAMKVCEDSQSYTKFAQSLMQLPLASDEEIEHHWKFGLKHV